MKMSLTCRFIALALTVPTGYLMAVTVAGTPAPGPGMPSMPGLPYRMPSISLGPPIQRPYEPAPSDVRIVQKSSNDYHPLNTSAATASKKWSRNTWIETGGIERRHFWLVHPLDTAWEKRLVAFVQEREFWSHHQHLINLCWLGQGWIYLDSTTQPTTFPSELIWMGPARVRPSTVALRVHALRVLQSLHLTSGQFHSLQESLSQMTDAGDVVDADVVDNILTTKPDCYATLNSLYRDSVLSNDDQSAADGQRLLSLEDKYQVSVEPTVVVTDAAREQAQKVFAMMNPPQIASYLATRAQVVPNVAEVLMAGMDESRKIADVDFGDYCNCLAERIAVLTTGLDPEANEPVIARVKQMLAEARNLNESAYEDQRSDFQNEIRGIEENCGAIQMIAHSIQWDIACFLSNPQAKGMTTIRARQLQQS
jgi:hypothetical protein